MASLSRHGSKSTHLPHQPFIDGHALAFIGRIELAELAAEILQDRTRFKYRDRLAARAFGIDDGWHTIIRRYFEKVRLELIAFADIHIFDFVGNT
ncbi:hypothetical protein D3C81_2016770 [compost metagenome]